MTDTERLSALLTASLRALELSFVDLDALRARGHAKASSARQEALEVEGAFFDAVTLALMGRRASAAPGDRPAPREAPGGLVGALRRAAALEDDVEALLAALDDAALAETLRGLRRAHRAWLAGELRAIEQLGEEEYTARASASG